MLETNQLFGRWTGMPLYRFVISDGSCSTQVIDLPDVDRARVEATRMLGELLNHDPEELWSTGALRVVVENPAGLVLFEVDALGIEAPATRKRGQGFLDGSL